MPPEPDLHHVTVPTAIGALTIFADNGGIKAIESGTPGSPPRTTALLDAAGEQLAAYFDGRLKSFDLPLAPDGTARQQDLWRAMADIPYGSTWTYGELSAHAGSSARAIGGACARNPIPILIPCHRVLPKSGGLGDYSFAEGTATKHVLLALEGASIPAGTRPSNNAQIALPL